MDSFNIIPIIKSSKIITQLIDYLNMSIKPYLYCYVFINIIIFVLLFAILFMCNDIKKSIKHLKQ